VLQVFQESNNRTWIVPDLMVPGLMAEVCARYDRKPKDLYILMLTAKGEEIDRAIGFIPTGR